MRKLGEKLEFKGDVLEKADAKPKEGAGAETQALRRRRRQAVGLGGSV